jgi:hypothetical protein
MTDESYGVSKEIFMNMKTEDWIDVEELFYPNYSLAHEAAKRGDLDMLKKWINKAGLPINTVHHGDTFLHYAAINNQLAVAKYLISAQADVNIKNRDDQTALDIARNEKHEEMTNFLYANSSWKAVQYAQRFFNYLRTPAASEPETPVVHHKGRIEAPR